MFSKLLATAIVAVMARSAIAHPVGLERRDSGISVELKPVSNTEVDAVVTNTAGEAISLLNYGTFFDDDKVQKVSVKQNGSEVPFLGILKNYLLTDLPAEAFTTLAPGESVSTTINIPAIHEVAGGDYSIVSFGALPYAKADSTELAGAVNFESNTLAMSIDGEVAAAVKPAISRRSIDKRTVIQNCSGSKGTSLRNALSNAVTLSNNAATAATSGSTSTFNTYYKSTSSSVRSIVAARFEGVVTEASSTTTGATTYSCTDDYDVCTSGVLAYTYPSLNHIANCDLYYSDLPLLTTTCHAQDQTTTTIHEFTHAPGTYSPGTDDYAYGYSASTALSSSQAVLNADTYALYANAIYVGC
ncbi:putative 24 kda metalloproteinase precursor [Phaeomoniella chlamydospora]|uniref:Neutral protease 2 n=1 Tax=Phaeomoniella chlamydospora TaxID=158046 RepID=A0A0G2E3A8_PHACM|nr:putative 24 kda metalloproteinase precursor [Phaeomoniella chlamydospora]